MDVDNIAEALTRLLAGEPGEDGVKRLIVEQLSSGGCTDDEEGAT